jgi:hypothetical protein
LAVLWGAAAGLAVLYVLLFLLARRPVSLRPPRLGWPALAVFVVRIGLIPLGCPVTSLLDGVLLAAAGLAGVGLTPAQRLWLLRAEAPGLREQIETACRGLFLQFAEAAPGRFTLTAKAGTWHLRTLPLSRRVQLIVLPRAEGPGKLALLLHWLSKQYPGPVPRLHFTLDKE